MREVVMASGGRSFTSCARDAFIAAVERRGGKSFAMDGVEMFEIPTADPTVYLYTRHEVRNGVAGTYTGEILADGPIVPDSDEIVP